MSTRESRLRKKVQELIAIKLQYFESALRDAHSLGAAKVANPRATANLIYTYHLGVVTQCRIQNDLRPMRLLAKNTLALIGAPISPRKSSRHADLKVK